MDHTIDVQRFWDALKDVKDPEFPISVVDMGLICDIQASGNGALEVTMTFTSTACPVMNWIQDDIKKRLLEEPDVTEVNIKVTWDKAWTHKRLTSRGSAQLKDWGVTI